LKIFIKLAHLIHMEREIWFNLLIMWGNDNTFGHSLPSLNILGFSIRLFTTPRGEESPKKATQKFISNQVAHPDSRTIKSLTKIKLRLFYILMYKCDPRRAAGIRWFLPLFTRSASIKQNICHIERKKKTLKILTCHYIIWEVDDNNMKYFI